MQHRAIVHVAARLVEQPLEREVVHVRQKTVLYPLLRRVERGEGGARIVHARAAQGLSDGRREARPNDGDVALLGRRWLLRKMEPAVASMPTRR